MIKKISIDFEFDSEFIMREIELVLKHRNIASFFYDFSNYLRSLRKHGDEKYKIEEIEGVFYEMLEDNELNVLD